MEPAGQDTTATTPDGPDGPGGPGTTVTLERSRPPVAGEHEILVVTSPLSVTLANELGQLLERHAPAGYTTVLSGKGAGLYRYVWERKTAAPDVPAVPDGLVTDPGFDAWDTTTGMTPEELRSEADRSAARASRGVRRPR